MATSIYTADDVLSIIRVVSPNSRPAIDHRHQMELQSAITIDILQLPSIIPNYSYILIQGNYLSAQEIMSYIQILYSWDGSYLYMGT
jgi:hypothetical protein